MSIGPVIRSLLKESVQNLPEDYARKNSAGVTADLLKKGVKSEELEYADMDLPKGKVTKADLVKAEESRKDKFSTTERSDYRSITVNKSGMNNPTYKEKILQFTQDIPDAAPKVVEGNLNMTSLTDVLRSQDFDPDPTFYLGDNADRLVSALNAGDLEEANNLAGLLGIPESIYLSDISDMARQSVTPEASRYTSDHFQGVPDYLAHTRIHDEVMDGKPTRVLTEIQSDLHQQGRQHGYAGSDTFDSSQAERLETLLNTKPEEAEELAVSLGWSQDEGSIEQWLYNKRVSGEGEGVPKSPMEKSWLRKGIERELVDAVNEGQEQLAIPISGEVDDLIRAPGVQKWYETQVLNTAKKIAKQTGSDFEIKSVGSVEGAQEGKEGVKYAVIKPKGNFSTTLYSTPAAGALAAYTAYESGKTDEEVIDELKYMGLDVEDMPEVQKQMDFITQSLESGHTLDEVSEFMSGKEVRAETTESTPTLPAPGTGPYRGTTPNNSYSYGTPKGKAYELLDEEGITAKDLVRSLEVLKPTMVSDTLVSIPAYFGSEEAKQQFDAAKTKANDQIVQIAKRDFGIDLTYEIVDVGDIRWFENGENGRTEISHGFWEEMSTHSGEMAGGLAGAIAGFAMAPPHPVAKAAGGIIGGIVGAVSGDQVDYLRESIKLSQEMEAEAMIYRAFNAAEVASISEVLGFGAIKAVGLGWKGVKRMKDAVLDGNTEGAYRALKDTLFLEDDEIAQIVERFKKLNPGVKGSEKQVAIQAVALTEPGAQSLIYAAGQQTAKASNAAFEAGIRRSKEVLETTANLTDPNVAQKFKQDLANYEADVKDFYSTIKAQATQQPNGKAISFDYDELAIDPVLESMYKNIEDPDVAAKFLHKMQLVKSKSTTRDFGDLIELRQIVNDFLYNKRVTKHKDVDKLRGVINNIDGAIEDSAQLVMTKPDEWLADWQKARSEYSNMKKIQSKSFYRMMFGPKGEKPVQPEAVVRGMTRYITAMDGSWEDVMSKLPLPGRKMYEGAVVDAFSKKFTMRATDGTEVINFPLLADELKRVQLTTPDARAVKAAIIEMSETFKNDAAIMGIGRSWDKLTVNQGLTDNILVKAKFELASKTYTKVRGMLPGAIGREQDLIKQVAKLLANPLDSKSSKALANELSADVNLTESLKVLQRQEALARAKGKQSGLVKIYRNGKTQGSGPYTMIPKHRIATAEEVRTIADAEAVTTYSEVLDDLLKQRGFLGLIEGTDRVRKLK